LCGAGPAAIVAAAMKIAKVTTNIVKPSGYSFNWGDDQPTIDVALTFLRITTDDGLEGHASTWLPGPHSEVAENIEMFARNLLVGRDPLDREAVWQELMMLTRNTISPKAASAVDTALWDLAGKAAGIPVYKLLGAYRDAIPAYASTTTYPNVADYVELALECRAKGFTAFKIHAYGDPDRDVEVCRAVREAVGPDMALMLDPVNSYDYLGAMRAGHALDELDFHWFEAPTHDEDIAGHQALVSRLRTPIAVGESNVRGIWDYANYLTAGAADIVRCIGDAVGGITAMRKIGALAECFNRNMESHSYGSTLVQAAHLHYMLSVKNAEYFELPVPGGLLDFGMRDSIGIDSDGLVHAPTGPGLGYEVDWDVVEDATVLKHE
jgi:L-alanine-DL-glutamate epimerase-like enolase superfamily enzyme